jgi:uracil-DNA glycosylase family 4
MHTRQIYEAIAAKLDSDMRELASFISSCNRCGGRGKGLPGSGRIGSQIFMLAGTPGPAAGPGNPWGEWRDEFMREAGESLGWDLENIYFSTALRCPGRRPSVGDLRRCVPYLREEFFTIRPRLAVVCGKVAAVALRAALGGEAPEKPKAGESFEIFSTRILFNLDIARVGEEEEASRIFRKVMGVANELLEAPAGP